MRGARLAADDVRRGQLQETDGGVALLRAESITKSFGYIRAIEEVYLSSAAPDDGGPE
jgi:hypothetical protein